MKLSVPMLVLAAGLSAAANTFAQSNAPAAATASSSSSRSSTVLSDGTHEVRIESDGVTARVTLDGNQVAQLSIADDWMTHKVTDASGNIIATIWRNGQGDTNISAAFGNQQPRSYSFNVGGGGANAGPWLAKLEKLMQDEDFKAGIADARGQFEAAIAMAQREMPRVMIGVTMDGTDSDAIGSLGYAPEKTATIASVVEDGPAAKAGIQEGDVIVAFDNAASADADAIREALQDNNPGDAIAVSYVRNGAVTNTTITLEAYKPEAFGSNIWRTWTPNAGAGNGVVFGFTDEEINRLQEHIADLSEKLGQISDELATAIGARAQELGKMATELSTEIANQAAELARRSAQTWAQSWAPSAQGQRVVRIPRDAQGNPQEIVVVPTPVPGAPVPPGAPNQAALQSMSDRIRQIEDRFGRVEELLQVLANQQQQQQQAQPSGGGNH